MNIKNILELIKGLLKLQVELLKDLPETVYDLGDNKKYESILKHHADLLEKAISKHVTDYVRISYQQLALPYTEKSIEDLKKEIQNLIEEKDRQLSTKDYMLDKVRLYGDDNDNLELLVTSLSHMELLAKLEYVRYFEKCFNYFILIDYEIKRNINSLVYQPCYDKQLYLNKENNKYLLDQLLSLLIKYRETIIENCSEIFPIEWLVSINLSSFKQLSFEQISVPMRFDKGKMFIFKDIFMPFYEEGRLSKVNSKLYNILVDSEYNFYIAHLIVASTNSYGFTTVGDKIMENIHLKINPISLEALQNLTYFDDIKSKEEQWLTEERIKLIEESFKNNNFFVRRIW